MSTLRLSKNVQKMAWSGVIFLVAAGCGGGGFNLRNFGVLFAPRGQTVKVPAVTQAGVCAGATDLSLNRFDLNLDQNAGTAGATIIAGSTQAAIASSTLDNTTHTISVAGTIVVPPVGSKAFTFLGTINTSVTPQTVTGIFDAGCWKKSLTLVATSSHGSGGGGAPGSLVNTFHTGTIGASAALQQACPVSIGTSNCSGTEFQTYLPGGEYIFLDSANPARTFFATWSLAGTALALQRNFPGGVDNHHYTVSFTNPTTLNLQETSHDFSGAPRPTERPFSVLAQVPQVTAAQLTARPLLLSTLAAPGQPAQGCPTTLTIGSPPETCSATDTLTFSANGNLRFDFTPVGSPPAVHLGTWSLSGNMLTTVLNGVTAKSLASFSGNKLTTVDFVDGVTPPTSDGVIKEYIQQ